MIIAAASLCESVDTLCGFGSRHFLSEGNARAAEWLAARLRGLGYVVERQPFDFEGRTFHNVYTRPEERRPFLLLAHYDTWGDEAGSQGTPGADDNASGVAITLEVARLLRERGSAHICQFLFTNLEEEGGVGASSFAAQARAAGVGFGGVVNLDTIGIWTQSLSAEYPIQVVANEQSAAWAAAFRAAFSLPTGACPIPFKDDHARFWEQGYPAIELCEPGIPDVMHTPDDLPANLDYGVMAAIAEAVAEALWELAGTRGNSWERSA